MKIKPILIITLLCCGLFPAFSQSSLTIKKIMQDPKTWVGTSPSRVFWSEDGQKIYFNWNPDQNMGDSLYYITPEDLTPRKVSPTERLALPSSRSGDYSRDHTKKVYTKNGDIYSFEIGLGTETKIIDLLTRISSVKFNQDETSLLFEMDNNLYAWEIETGFTSQMTDFKSGKEKKESKNSEQDQWIENDEMSMMEVLTQRKEVRESREAMNEANEVHKPLTIYTGSARASNIKLSPDGKYITYSLFGRAQNTKRTEVPTYVTESGYTENLNARTNVGTTLSSRDVWIYDITNSKAYQVKNDELPGITDVPDFYADYDKYKDQEEKIREVYTQGLTWSENGQHAIVTFRSKDNKDRWIMLLNPADGSSALLDRQRDEAWIGGPGISRFGGGSIGWMEDNKTIWFQSEESGYSHLYSLNVESGKKKALTKGDFEVYNPRLSKDKASFYFEANIEHPGVRHLYTISISGGKPEKLTSMDGRNDTYLSPDETSIAILRSFSNQPTELYLAKNEKGAEAIQATKSTTKEFDAYSWRTPEHITFKARDNAKVYARLYQPENVEKGGPAVVFVHGAGYLQNAHKWWSSYHREYQFHNFLVDNGYTVLDIDYRASAGYGRDWRTAIYRHMGGWDLNDNVDGAKYLVEELGVDKDRIGIYGGSYGGFITLMALFMEPDVFAAGAALRSVTDWAHYNHGYTSNILNTPVQDSIAYRKSSPIYYADRLTKPLLMAHGMIDTNVHFQDVVRLSQRFIELGKEDWEMAIYPVESHGFREPSSWTDEYTRIFKLFEKHLK